MEADVFVPPAQAATETIEPGQLEAFEHFREAGLTEIAPGLHEEPGRGIRQIGRFVIPAPR